MKTMPAVNYTNPIRHIDGKSAILEVPEQRSAEQIDLTEIKSLLILCNQFFYITDTGNFNNIYVSPNVRKILGFESETLTDLYIVYNLIHPDDREFVRAFSMRVLHCTQLHGDVLKTNPFSAVISIDFRMRCANGRYIRLNRQTCCYKIDAMENRMYTLSLFTDIDHIKRSNLITYAWKADFKLNLIIDDLIEHFHHRILTSREMEVIRLLSLGFSAGQIGKKLFISTNTVIRHRKNILHKTGSKNTAELVRYAMENGLL